MQFPADVLENITVINDNGLIEKLQDAKIKKSPLLKLSGGKKRSLIKNLNLKHPFWKSKKDSFEDYLSKRHFQSSDFKSLYSDAVKFVFEKYIERPDTKAFEQGRIAHKYILEPNKRGDIVSLKGDSRTLKGLTERLTALQLVPYKNYSEMKATEMREEVERLTVGKDVVTQEQMAMFKIWHKRISIYEGGMLRHYLKGSIAERSFYGDLNGFKTKVRPDALNLKESCGHDVIISLKTTSAKNEYLFKRDCEIYNYDLSEYVYQQCLNKATGRNFKTLMITCQTVAPFGVFAFECTENFLENGRYKYEKSLQIFQDMDINNYLRTNKTPFKFGYDKLKDDLYKL